MDFLAANGFEPATAQALPFSRRQYHAGPTGPVLPAPRAEILLDSVRGDTRKLRLRLLPAHLGDDLTLQLPDSIAKASVRVDGEPLSASRWPWWHGVTLLATPAEGITVAFAAPAGEPFEAYLVGETHGLPAASAGVADARDAVATQAHGGDRTAAFRKLTWLP